MKSAVVGICCSKGHTQKNGGVYVKKIWKGFELLVRMR